MILSDILGVKSDIRFVFENSDVSW